MRFTLLFFIVTSLFLPFSSAPYAVANDIEVVSTSIPVPDPKLAPYQERLDNLYRELLSIKQTPEFAERGFGQGYQRAHRWKQNAIALRNEIDAKKLPYQLQYGAGDLLNLSDAYVTIRLNGVRDLNALHRFEEQIWDFRSNVRNAIDYIPEH